MELSYFLSLPEVPQKQRPKVVYHEQNLAAEVKDTLKARGWEPVDVRLLPNITDADKAHRVKSLLEGASLGSIELSKDRLKYVELEAKIVGLIGTKEVGGETSDKLDKAGLEALFPFATSAPKSTKLKGVALSSKVKKLEEAGRSDLAEILKSNGGDTAGLEIPE